MRGGHARSGPAIFNPAERALHGTRMRARHRLKGDAPPVGMSSETAVTTACEPPEGLSRAELGVWRYYAPLLAAAGRLTSEARGALAGYCFSQTMIGHLRRALKSRRREDIAARGAYLKEARQWLQVARLYENDLLLNPASAVRAPKPATPTEPDPFEEFDAPGPVQ
jgi:hypothetical protein